MIQFLGPALEASVNKRLLRGVLGGWRPVGNATGNEGIPLKSRGVHEGVPMLSSKIFPWGPWGIDFGFIWRWVKSFGPEKPEILAMLSIFREYPILPPKNIGVHEQTEILSVKMALASTENGDFGDKKVEMYSKVPMEDVTWSCCAQKVFSVI
jgi:hypothetical protein